MGLERQNACLELLPTEILHLLVDHLFSWDLKNLSCVSRQLREAFIPCVFRNVRFQFSKSGFDSLRGLLLSDLRHHVVSLIYVIPELLHPGNDFVMHTCGNC